VALGAAYASYRHGQTFAFRFGADATTAVIWPLIVDGLLIVATVELRKTTPGPSQPHDLNNGVEGADRGGGRLAAWVSFLFTNLTTDQAGPAQLAQLVRQHWGVEALHWLRDTVYREDHSRARTGSRPQVMAGLRNLAIGALHLA